MHIQFLCSSAPTTLRGTSLFPPNLISLTPMRGVWVHDASNLLIHCSAAVSCFTASIVRDFERFVQPALGSARARSGEEAGGGRDPTELHIKPPRFPLSSSITATPYNYSYPEVIHSTPSDPHKINEIHTLFHSRGRRRNFPRRCQCCRRAQTDGLPVYPACMA